MLKKSIILLVLFGLVCCYCLENDVKQPEEARAKKKKSSLRLLAIMAIAVIAKIVLAKVMTFVMFVAFFQKLFYVGGLLLNYFLKNQQERPPPPSQVMMYGPPQEYDTVGYSYDPPQNEPFQAPDRLPSIADFSGGFNWLFNKNQPH